MDTMQLGTKGNGSAIKLTPTIVGTGKSVKWTTSDKTVATVSGGRVTGKNTGTAIITATANGVSATCEVTVIKDSLSISEEKVLLYTGETKQIRSNATSKEVVVWESSNDNVVTVDEKGKLTAVGEGFVELVEEDREQSPEAVETVRRVLEPMIREGADQIVLGCTHYPFLLPVFRQVIGERGVAVVDPSPAVGRRVGQLLDQYDLRAEKGATANYGFLTFADEAYRSRLECKAFG